MKTIFFLLAGFCAASVAAFSQDTFDPKSIIDGTLSGSGILTKPNQSTAFRFESYNGHFIRGWNWGEQGSLLDSAMHMNMYHGIANYTRSGRINEPLSWSYSGDFKKEMFVVEPFLPCNDAVVNRNVNPLQYTPEELGFEVAGSEWTNAIMNAQALHLEPTLDVNTTALGVQEKEGTIYGFRFTEGELENHNGNSFRKFKPDLIPLNGQELTVLRNAWRTDILRFENCRQNELLFGCSGAKKNERPKELENQADDIKNFHDFNGKRFYLSINLKTDAPPQQVSLNDSDVLLKIKIPIRTVYWTENTSETDEKKKFTMTHEYTNAMFYQVPKSPITASDTLQIRSTEPLINSQIRGVANKTFVPASQGTSELSITWGMLKSYGQGGPITLSALMTFMGGYNNNDITDQTTKNLYRNDNPRFLPRDITYRTGAEVSDGERKVIGMDKGTKYIDSLDIQVTYCGKIPVSINWIRLETPRAQQLFRGRYDRFITENVRRVINLVYDTQDKPSWMLSTKAPSGDGTTSSVKADPPLGWKLCGIYGMDETGPFHYSAMRYVNRLLDNKLKQEQFSRSSLYYLFNRDIENNEANHLRTMTGMEEFWNGSNIFLGNETMSPLVRWGKRCYDKKNNNRVDYLAFSGGYAGYETDIYGVVSVDSASSGYETAFISLDFCIAPNNGAGGKTLIGYRDDPYLTSYPFKDVQLFSIQSKLERDIHDCYYKQPGLLFSGGKWWANVWIDPGLLTFPKSDDPSFRKDNSGSIIRTLGHKDRFRTAEEVRAQIWYPLLFGAKGLIYWFKNSSGLIDNRVAKEDELADAQLGVCSYDFIRGPRTFWLQNGYNYTDQHTTNSKWQDDYKTMAESTTLTYKDWLRSELLGGDYLNPNETDATPHIAKTYTFQDYSTPPKIWNRTGFGSLLKMEGYEWEKMGWNTYDASTKKVSMYSTIYTGMKNARIEIEKLHRLIMENEAYIMELNLMACYGKGFIKMYAQNPSSGVAFDGHKDTILKKYLDISGTLTRPLARIAHTSKRFAEYEQNSGLDSGFYDITLFTNPAVTIGATSINKRHEDSCIVLGVMNRRTDPLFRYVKTLFSGPGPDGEDYNLGQMNYLTTDEWDSLKTNGGAHWKVPNDRRSKEWWQARYNERLGGREITLKFQYKSPSDSDPNSKGKLLRVRELVAKGVKGLDTVISSTSYLSINFEPGEGKLLEVTMRVPENTVASGTGADDGVGSLANTGQRKIVAVPKYLGMSNGIPVFDSNNVRYHMVYHRADNVATNGFFLRKVFYKRSRVTPRNITSSGQSGQLTNGLEWEPEICVSDNLQPHNRPGVSEHDDKAFPSVVVRFDDVSQKMKTFIVFAAQSSATLRPAEEATGGIYESCFDAEEPDIPRILTAARYLDSLSRMPDYYSNRRDILSQSGHPVINAHTDGQYVCYSDRTRGIVAQWQPQAWPNSPLVYPPIYISAGVSWRLYRVEKYSSAQQPSINSYSFGLRSGSSDSTALLVWQEYMDIFDRFPFIEKPGTYVFAAHLDHDAQAIKIRPIDPMHFEWTNSARTIALVSSTAVGVSNTSPCTYQIQSDGYRSLPLSRYRLLDHVDSFWRALFESLLVWPNNMYSVVWRSGDEIVSRRLYVSRPQISGSKYGELCGDVVVNRYNLTSAKFVLKDYSVSGTFRDKGRRYTWGNNSVFIEKAFPLDILIEERLTGTGTSMLLQPHMEWSDDFSIRGVSEPRLSEYMLIDQPAQSNIARRVYRKPDPSAYSAITASAAHLMKSSSAASGIDNVQLHGFGTLSERLCVEFRDEADRTLPLGVPETSELSDDTLANIVLATDWFRVGTEYPFHLLYNGTGTEFMALHIQRRGDSRAYQTAYQCAAEPSTSNEVRAVSGRLLNGDNAEYRFILKPKLRDLVPTYSFFIQHNAYDDDRDAGLPKVIADLSSLNKEAGDQLSIVAYPNPASSHVDVIVQSPTGVFKQGMTLKVLNILGQSMYEGTVGINGTATVETDSWPDGMYSIRCEYWSGLKDCKTVARDFVIRR